MADSAHHESSDPRRSAKKLTPQDFEITSLLGEGSYARVMHGRKKDTGEEYAIKILEKSHIQKENKVHQVMTEKNILSRLNHPNIVKLYFTFQDRHRLYFVIELAPGGELFEQIRRLEKCPVELARFYTAEVVNMLEYLAKQGIAHRDLKPENLLLSAEGHLKLADFATAKVAGETHPHPHEEAEDRSRRLNTFVGTAEYVSPEVLSDAESSCAADLWALGCIVFQLLAGRPPFRAESEYLTFQKILSRNFTYPDNFPPAARDLVDRLLVVDPSQRLGAGAPGSDSDFVALKAHPFFEGLDFETLHLTTPPSYSDTKKGKRRKENQRSPSRALRDEAEEDGEEEEDIHDATPTIGASFSSVAERVEILEKSSIMRFLDTDRNETIRLTGLVLKRRGLFSKKRQLVLTNLPRIFYLEPDKFKLKGEIPWSEHLMPELKNPKTFHVHTPSRTYYLQDVSGNAQRWVDAISEVMAEWRAKQQSEEAGLADAISGLTMDS